MRIQAYLRILSDEDTIRAIDQETRLTNASVKQLRARRQVDGGHMWWNWETSRTAIDIDNPDEGIRALLQAHQTIFPIIKKYHGPETDVYLEIITHYEEGEEPRGLYLSAGTVHLLSEIGGALDNDVAVIPNPVR